MWTIDIGVWNDARRFRTAGRYASAHEAVAALLTFPRRDGIGRLVLYFPRECDAVDEAYDAERARMTRKATG